MISTGSEPNSTSKDEREKALAYSYDLVKEYLKHGNAHLTQDDVRDFVQKLYEFNVRNL